MSRSRSTTIALIVLGVGTLAIYVAQWLSVSHMEIGRSDFTSTYVGATLWSQRHHADLYDDGLQRRLHASLIAPDVEGNLPFVNPPIAAVVAAPLTLFSLDIAYRIWSTLQILLVIAATAVAVRAAQRSKLGTRDVSAAAIALAIPGVLALLLLGQWDGVSAAALACAYAAWKADRRATGGAVLASGMLLAKPHLALGLATFVVGWRDRRVLIGAATASAVVIAANLAAVGTSGVHGFIAADLADSHWVLASFLGFNGFFGSWIANASAGEMLGGMASAIALAAALWLGNRLRQDGSLELALGGAALLSLVASPHLLWQDLVVLCPVAAWMLVWTKDRMPVLLAWGLLCGFAVADFGNQQPAPPGRLVPVALAGCAAAAMVVTRRQAAA